MFSKKKSEQQISEISTIIGEGTIFEGKIKLKSSIRVDGKVYGEISSEGDVTIGKNGYAENAIKARNLYIAGKVKADVDVLEKLHILETGYLEGVASLNTIVIEENGQFHGTSKMKSVKDKQSIVEMEQEIQEKSS